jgi:hypothetical protein
VDANDDQRQVPSPADRVPRQDEPKDTDQVVERTEAPRADERRGGSDDSDRDADGGSTGRSASSAPK